MGIYGWFNEIEWASTGDLMKMNGIQRELMGFSVIWLAKCVYNFTIQLLGLW